MNDKYREPLESRSRISWKIRLWDEEDRCGEWSEEAFFETGLLKAEDWKAQWIDPEPAHDPEER